MPIEFDTLSEVEAFCQIFELKEGVSTKGQVKLQSTRLAKSRNSNSQVKLVQPKSLNLKRSGTKKPKNKNTPKLQQGSTVTAIVQSAIDALIEGQAPFSANDVFAKVSESNTSASKPTVLSTASKLLSTKYSHITTEERPSTGFRPLKVYLPEH